MKSKSSRTRLDLLLIERGLAETRAKAQALILAGAVFSGEKKLDKAGTAYAGDTPLEVKSKDHPWVSRGGIKLAHALDQFAIDVTGLIALDVGASTGGFTDVLLQKGAARVYAVDVGHGQLAWKLRQDPRVVVLERVNARHLSAKEVPEPPDIVVCDASFIGLEIVLPAALGLAKAKAKLVALIKPQFEVGPERVGKRGVVRDPAVHAAVCAGIEAFVASLGWAAIATLPSPIEGGEGNREFLLGARRG